jgi:Zn-dependent protease
MLQNLSFLKGSIKIAKLFGVPVLLHWSFLVLIAVGGYYGQMLDLEVHEIGWWALFGASVFVCIILHEFGHALTARKFGVKTKDIVLFPIGGMARLNRLPDKPFQEFVVALAGPFVNILIAFVLFPFFWFYTRPALVTHAVPDPDNIDDNYFFFLPLLLFLNLLLALFNLIPAFPMDGGRILRALLTIKLGRLNATKIAVALGHVIAVGLILYGMWSGRFSYLPIGLFIAYTAMAEYRWINTENLLSSHKVKEVFRRDHHPLTPNDEIQEVQEVFEKTGQRGFLVFDENGCLLGTFDYDEIAMKKNGQMEDVNSFYRKDFGKISLNATLKEANQLAQEKGWEVLAVMDEGELVGVLEEGMIWSYLSDDPNQSKK